MSIKQLGGRVVVVALGVLVFSAGSAFAMQRVPDSIPGVVPHQAPLQPIPQGSGPNISNNIVQTPESGVPDSASTVTQGTSSSNENAGTPSEGVVGHSQPLVMSEHSSTPLRYMVVVILAVLILSGFGVYLWRQRSSEHPSK